MALFRRDQNIARLRKVPIFKGCSRRQLLTITRISEVIDVPAGKTLVRADRVISEAEDDQQLVR